MGSGWVLLLRNGISIVGWELGNEAWRDHPWFGQLADDPGEGAQIHLGVVLAKEMRQRNSSRDEPAAVTRGACMATRAGG